MLVTQKNKRVVDLCIWVDENAYKKDVDKDELFDSLYWIVNSISIKHKMLPNWKDYQPFSFYAACRLYGRLTNPKQFVVGKDGKQMKKIKSILNFIKKTMHPMIVDFQNQHFEQNFVPNLHGDAIDYIRQSSIYKIDNQFREMTKIDFKWYLSKICDTTKKFIDELPYSNYPLMSHRLYMSCLMTMLNQITLNNENKERVALRNRKGYKTYELLSRIYEEEKEFSLVLYHLDNSMSNYVRILVNRIMSLVAQDLKYLIGSNQPSDQVVQSILSNQGENMYVEE